jgi:hypothetical protein
VKFGALNTNNNTEHVCFSDFLKIHVFTNLVLIFLLKTQIECKMCYVTTKYSSNKLTSKLIVGKTDAQHITLSAFTHLGLP